MRLKLLAVAALLAFSTPVFAQDAAPANEEVSDAVDIAFWCGAAFTVAAMKEGITPEDKAAADELATKLFARAETALAADGVEKSEYDRLTDYYVNEAVAQVHQQSEEPKYTVEECTAEAGAK
jgi:hypothetical protein